MTLIGALALLASLGGVLGWLAWGWAARPRNAVRIPGEDRRVTVEVLNSTTVDGLAREVTRRLRRAGIDVVNYGSARDSLLDSTTIVVRRGDSSAALRVRQALGRGRITVDRDRRLLLDASVLVAPDLARALGFQP